MTRRRSSRTPSPLMITDDPEQKTVGIYLLDATSGAELASHGQDRERDLDVKVKHVRPGPEIDAGVRGQGRPQGPRPQGEGRGQRPGLRPGVPAGEVLRHRRPRRHRRRAAGGQQHDLVELRPARRGEQGPVAGQGQGQAHLDRQGEGPLPVRRRQALGRAGELRPQVRPHPRALPAGVRPAADGRDLGAGRHPAPVRRGGDGQAEPVLDRRPEADPARHLRPRRIPGVPPPVHVRTSGSTC